MQRRVRKIRNLHDTSKGKNWRKIKKMTSKTNRKWQTQMSIRSLVKAKIFSTDAASQRGTSSSWQHKRLTDGNPVKTPWDEGLLRLHNVSRHASFSEGKNIEKEWKSEANNGRYCFFLNDPKWIDACKLPVDSLAVQSGAQIQANLFYHRWLHNNAEELRETVEISYKVRQRRH